MSSLEDFRHQIDEVDAVLLAALGKRLGICADVARFKRAHGIPMMQPARVEAVKDRAAERAPGHGLRGDFVRELYGMIIGEACRLEDDIIGQPAGETTKTTTSGEGRDVARAREPEGEREFERTSERERERDASPARFAILGATGAMGGLFANHLKRCGHTVSGYDLRAPDGATAADFDAFAVGDVRATAGRDAARLAAEADAVIVCLPHEAALDAIRLLAPRLPSGALVVDTLSVKTPVAELLAKLPPLACEYLSLNPMFAPSLGFKGQKVVAIADRAGARGEALMRTIERWGAAVQRMSAPEHDRACAVMQVATHMTLLSLGRTMAEAGIDVADLLRIAPPPHLMCLAMLSRILTAAPQTYWDIQRDNPFGAAVRRQLAAALADLDAIVERGDPAAFTAALESMRQAFEPQLESLTKMSANAIRGATDARL